MYEQWDKKLIWSWIIFEKNRFIILVNIAKEPGEEVDVIEYHFWETQMHHMSEQC